MTYALPPLDRAWVVLLALIGATWGWLIRPWLWPLYPLPRWWACLMGTMSQESAFDQDAQGDGGDSIGLFQFNDSQNLLIGDDPEGLWRKDPFWSGYACAAYVSGACVNPLFWLAALPGLGFPMMRRIWTHGTGSVDVAAAVAQVTEEPRGLPAFVFWSAALWPLFLVPLWLWGRARRRR